MGRSRRRPFTGAWIETNVIRTQLSDKPGRPFTGAWIETGTLMYSPVYSPSRPFTGAWIETMLVGLMVISSWSPLHGGVD